MEKQLFNWESWDPIDTMQFQFYKCVLKVPVGDFSAGDELDAITIDYEHATITLYEGDIGYVYALKFAPICEPAPISTDT